ncbi:MAG: nucleotidyltransferase family protein [Deltaproteobacteria bacterium]|nr:nucleotidyltransferase family protein [Deltaproteobacteria bacterium]
MKTREEIMTSLAKCKKKFQVQFKISKIALFGSYARGDQTESSDVDVLVSVDPSIGLNFVSLAEKIEEEIGLPTDVVSERAIKPHYRQAIEPDLIYV